LETIEDRSDGGRRCAAHIAWPRVIRFSRAVLTGCSALARRMAPNVEETGPLLAGGST